MPLAPHLPRRGHAFHPQTVPGDPALAGHPQHCPAPGTGTEEHQTFEKDPRPETTALEQAGMAWSQRRARNEGHWCLQRDLGDTVMGQEQGATDREQSEAEACLWKGR